MNFQTLLNLPPLFVEIGPDALKARRNGENLVLPLERTPDGRLTTSSKESTVNSLREFLKAKSWQRRVRTWCAIPLRGVSFRRFSLPGGTRDEFQQRLLLQIESEFPLAPDELAWGYQILNQPSPANGSAGRQDVLVAALKKELVEDYYGLLRAAGTEPVFTLGSLARQSYCRETSNDFAMLDIGSNQSELTIFKDAVPTSSRIIFWGVKNDLSLVEEKADGLARAIKGNVGAARILISGSGVEANFSERLATSLASSGGCQRIDISGAQGSSAAVAGLERIATDNSAPPLVIGLKPASTTRTNLVSWDWKKWGTRAGLLILALLALPYAEAFLLKSHLEKKVTSFKAESARLTVIDRELDFLRNLKLNQPPYLDVCYVLSKSVSPGTRFTSLSLNSHGEVSLRCAFRDGQEADNFRNKLITSGFFTNVVVEEQTPTPDRQRVNVRMSAQEKTAVELQVAAARLAANDSEKTGKAGAAGVPPMGGNLP